MKLKLGEFGVGEKGRRAGMLGWALKWVTGACDAEEASMDFDLLGSATGSHSPFCQI